MIPVYDKIVPALLSGGVCNLQKTCSFSPGVPVGPMLAKATKGVSEIVDKFQDKEFTCEYKYDGERAQVLIVPFIFSHYCANCQFISPFKRCVYKGSRKNYWIALLYKIALLESYIGFSR